MTVPTTSAPFDPLRLSKSMGRVAERSQKLVLEFLTRTPDFSPPGMAECDRSGLPRIDYQNDGNPMAFATATADLWVTQPDSVKVIFTNVAELTNFNIVPV